MSAEVQANNAAVDLPASLNRLVGEIDSKKHLLASSGDEELAAAALRAAKDIFELGLQNEPRSHPHLHPFLISILEPPSVGTRSKSKGKKAQSPTPPPETVDPGSVLPYTPLSELTTDGLDVEQIWAQLELRAEGVVKVVKEVGPGEPPVDLDDSDVGLEDDEDDDEDGSDEEMTIEEWKKMMADNGIDEDADSDEESGSGDDEEDSDESEGDSDDEDNMISWKDEDAESDEDDENSEEGDDDDEEDGETGSEDEEMDEEDLAELGADFDMDEDAEEGEGGEEESDDDRAALLGQDDEPGPSRRSKSRHPTLDDDFFSIDEFNRLTEEAEAGKLSSGRLGGDEDEEDEDDLGDAGALMLQNAPDEDEDIMFSDFFDVPREIKRAEMFKDKGKGKGKGKDRAREPKPDKKGKGKGKGVKFDEQVDEDEVDDEEEEGGRDVMGRVTGDLFDSDDEDEGVKTLSTHERQQLELAKQIAELEGQAIGPKDWTLMGEATSRARPENSLLEEDLDFEQVAKVVPVITEERVASIEEIIRKRIIDNNFDSTIRVRAYEPTPYLPSRYLELQDTQSSKSLAQIYEEEYQAAAAGGKAVDPRDEKLKKEHEEIDKLWGDICYKLDALSSLNFVPKAPKAQITTVDNVATATMESALPPTSAPTTLLAPEELFAPPTAKALVARSELTPEQAQAARGKRKREKKAERQKLGDMAELYGQRRGGVKAEKERALQGLVKTGKGVTVLGKGDKERGKAAKRAGEEAKNDGKRLKL